MVMPLWRSLHSLNLMLPKEDRQAMLLRLYNEIIPLQDNSKARFGKERNGVSDANNNMDAAPDPVPSVPELQPEDGEDSDGRAPGAKTGDAPYGSEDLPTILDATSGEDGGMEAS
ncbi:MAG: hypothetical protein Q9183_003779 [Haloplaca sp. 2 TL-2023]